ncbi:MAG: AmmeMemoRadiSam system protein B [Crenarchaeota archaeon]|nr:AmmeMemoRadiSam system protein B [Thermoproteota archaeon]
MEDEVREPAVAGFFYPGSVTELMKCLEWCFKHELGPQRTPGEVEPSGKYRIKSAIVPHAGYIYSGPCAAHVYVTIKEDRVPETIIILGPNHTGYGAPVSVFPRGIWRTPLGDTKVDDTIAEKLASMEPFKADKLAHLEEHSIEVQIPFLQYVLNKEFKIVPIVLMDQRLRTAREVAGAIYDLMQEVDKDIIVLASSDMSHYVSQKSAYEKDLKALEYVINLDIEGFYDVVEQDNITICGVGPIAVAALVAKSFGVQGALLKYYTSGDISGDKTAVVGYASLVFGENPPRTERSRVRREKIKEAPLVA